MIRRIKIIIIEDLIVDKADLLPVDPLLVVLLLLHLEDVRHEELLKVLVGVVDAELLEAVGVKVLKAEDVKDPDSTLRPLCLRLEDGHVHPSLQCIVVNKYTKTTCVQICTNTNTQTDRNTHANTDTAHEGLPVDDKYKKPAINPLRKGVSYILCLQCKFVNLIILCCHVLIFFGE